MEAITAKNNVAAMRAKIHEACRIRDESNVYRLAREAGHQGEAERLYRESPEYKQIEAAIEDFGAAVEAYAAVK